jgi:hypothetical protein
MLRTLLFLAGSAGLAMAHTVTGRDADFVRNSTGTHIAPFLYLGAKHMVTGYDHLLFLLGVIFFLYKLKDVAVYVTCFAIGHSITLLTGVLGGVHVNSYIVDALIGLSVVYKAFDNLDGFRTLFGFQINAKAAVLGFGLIHGFGLATKLQEFNLSREGLVPNMIAFNVILFVMTQWRRTADFGKHAVFANVLLMTAGFLLMGYQLSGYAFGSAA